MTVCPVCGRHPSTTSVRTLSDRVLARLRARRPTVGDRDHVCGECIDDAREDVMRDAVAGTRGLITPAEEDVISAVREDRLVSADAEAVLERSSRPSALWAERLATVVGSWSFVGTVGGLLVVWVVVNLLLRPLEPWPTAFLASTSAGLASLAALQGPVILMAQRRSRALDRVRSDIEYRVNLKAELEVRELSDRVERLLELGSDPDDR